MRPITIVIALIFFLAPITVLAQEQIDLPQAINYSLTQNKELKRAALSIDFGSLSVTGAKAEDRKC
ncbi:MAG: hypothetical protein AABY78_07740 [Nitrospirota bacterium]